MPCILYNIGRYLPIQNDGNIGNHMLQFNIITYYIGIYSGRTVTGKTFSRSEYVSVVNLKPPCRRV